MVERLKKVVYTKEASALHPIIAPHWLQGFVDFVREQGVVGLAVGLTLGIASKGVVDSLVANIFNPIVGLLTGGESLAAKSVCLNYQGATCINKLGYGQVLSDLLGFVIVAAIVYFVVKGLKLDKLDKPKDAKEADKSKKSKADKSDKSSQG